MNAYCERVSVDPTAIAFLFDGRRLRMEQTPDEVSFFSLSLFPLHIKFITCIHTEKVSEFIIYWFFFFFFSQLEMEDGDEIDAMLHQTGGAIDGGF